MRIKGVRSARTMGRWLRSRYVRGDLILLYHRIAAPEEQPGRDPFSLCVHPERFAQQMAVLRGLGTPAPLRDLPREPATKEASSPAIAVTFDDGYLDNLEEARPWLEEYQIPATFFIVTGSIGRSFWWDSLTEALYGPESLPPRLSLTEDGLTFEWDLQDSRERSRKALFSALYRLLRPLDPERRTPALERVRAWAGNGLNTPQRVRCLTESELSQLSSDDLLEIGSHSVTHSSFATLETQAALREIVESKTTLERLLGRPVSSFSYPHGLISRAAPDTPALVREAGFSRACLAETDLVTAGGDPFRLPRLWVGNWNGEEFARRLGRWLPK